MSFQQVGETLLVSDIIAAASRITQISAGDITGPSRVMHIVRVRHAVCFIARKYGRSYTVIGRSLGNRDHSTIIHAVEQADEFAMRYPVYRAVIADIEAVALKIAQKRQVPLVAGYQ